MILPRAAEVSRRYGDTLARDRITLDVAAGELVGLLGLNGAGKSPLVNGQRAGVRRGPRTLPAERRSGPADVGYCR